LDTADAGLSWELELAPDVWFPSRPSSCDTNVVRSLELAVVRNTPFEKTHTRSPSLSSTDVPSLLRSELLLNPAKLARFSTPAADVPLFLALVLPWSECDGEASDHLRLKEMPKPVVTLVAYVSGGFQWYIRWIW
jgi:hypothetical protein